MSKSQRILSEGIPDEQEFMQNLSEQSGGWMEFLENRASRWNLHTYSFRIEHALHHQLSADQ